MSAWIVSKGHIDCLVQAMVVEGLATFDDADDLGKMLWNECLNSVSDRYPDCDRDDKWPGPNDFSRASVEDYRFTGVEALLDDAIVVEQAKCYRYQSCEHDGWEASEARALNEKLLDIIIFRNKDDREFDQRIEQAPWGILDIHEAVA